MYVCVVTKWFTKNCRKYWLKFIAFLQDLTSVQNVLKKHALVEADRTSHQGKLKEIKKSTDEVETDFLFPFFLWSDRIDGVRIAADQFSKTGHFDADTIVAKASNLDERFNGLMEPLQRRKHRLMESLAVQQLFRDVEDEEAWIREKEPIVASNNRGRDLIGVQVSNI